MSIKYRKGELKCDFTYEPFRATIVMVEFCPKVILLHCKTDTGEVIEVSSFDVDGKRKYFQGDIIEGYLPCYQRNMNVKRYLIDGYAAEQEKLCYVRVAVPHKKDELLDMKKQVIELVKSYDDIYSLKQFKEKILADKGLLEDNFEYIQPDEIEDDNADIQSEVEQCNTHEVWG